MASLQRSWSPDPAPSLLCSARRGHLLPLHRRATTVPRLPLGHRDWGRTRLLVPLDPSQSSLGRPGLNNEFGGLGVESSDDDLGDVGDEHLPVRFLVRLVRGHRPGGDGASGALRLARPVVLLALLRVEGWAVQGEAGIPREVRPLARAGHRTEAEITVRELALDARNAWRAVGAQRCDCLMATGVEQPPHSLREFWLRLLDRLPRRHRRSVLGCPSGVKRTTRTASS